MEMSIENRNMLYDEPSEHAGKTVRIKSGKYAGEDYLVEDWWYRVGGGSWMSANGNPACMNYGVRSAFDQPIPTDDNVLYGKIDGYGCLIHISELDLK